MHPLLRVTEHRPWPLPRGPWIMRQTWHDLLFAHWPIPPAVMRPLVPPQLELDTFDGPCWLGIVPFWMSGVRSRALPPLPGLSTFTELNVRTYVTVGGKPGVYFFSLDASSRAAVWGARTFYRLPYFYAEMKSEERGGSIHYSSHRVSSAAGFRASYRPISHPRIRDRGSLEDFLTARYCLYTVHRGRVYRCEIHHLPWPLQDAEAEFQLNTMAAAAGISPPDTQPLLHFSRKLDVLIWPLRPVR
jgi:uncharacterized protein YqjF (DUF2071 family)